MCVVAEFGMRVERKVIAIDSEMVLEQQLQQFVALACPWMGRSPEKSVVNDEEIGFGANCKFDGGKRGIYGRCDASNGAAVFDL